jgi:hypothetical protein
MSKGILGFDLDELPNLKYEEPVCGKDLTFGAVPASCGRAPGHEGDCSLLSEADLQAVDNESRRILAALFPRMFA